MRWSPESTHSRPATTSPADVDAGAFLQHARVRAYARGAAAALLALVAAALVAVGTGVDRAEAGATPTPPPATVPAVGGNWFLLGADVPYLRWRCDFGCGASGGVRSREAEVDAMFRTLGARGVHTVRWYLFPGDAWQVTRTGAGFPTGVSAAALADLDLAVSLARKHDVYLVPALFPSPAAIPRTWFTVANQRVALARELAPLFRRYARTPHVLAWEVLTSPEPLVDSGAIERSDARALASRLRLAVAAEGATKTTVGAVDVSRLDTWTGLGFDFLSARSFTTQTGASSALTATTTGLAGREGVTEPVVVNAIDAGSQKEGATQLRRLRANGYAGAMFWSYRGVAGPAGTGNPRVPLTTTWFHGYRNPNSGPRSRPLNLCIGPDARDFMCPNIRMARPTSLSVGTIGGRRVLYSTNSLDSVGRGPASLHGRRNGARTMIAKQVLHRAGGGKVLINTEGKLLFKAIPGQYRYWKWNGAAQMELWRIDGRGNPVSRARFGPKTVYCLRDLSRTHGSLPNSPGGRVYPGCSQNPNASERTLGTSVGWSDVYPASYHENWVDITGLRGCFAYVHVGDPTNVIYELNEDDNRSHVVVKLPYTGSNAGCPGARPIPSTGSNGGY